MGTGVPWERELDSIKGGNRNTTTRQWERLMFVESQNHSRGLVEYATP